MKNFHSSHPHLNGSIQWQSPANIALIKYWGKKQQQLPCNPSLSLTLTESVTHMKLTYEPRKDGKPQLDFQFNHAHNPAFAARIQKFITTLTPLLPFLAQLKLKIHTTNTFPHTAGIASSASSMSALALCLCTLAQKIEGGPEYAPTFYRKASYIARLASGSACRSIYGGFVTWGTIPGHPHTSDEHASPLETAIHPIFQDLCNAILVVDQGTKKVSSSKGHQLMGKNSFQSIKFAKAKEHTSQLIQILGNGDLEQFIKIVEQEAMLLHAMMMSSDPYTILLKPASLHIIENILSFRKQTRLPIAFTIDAGPNIHLLYPSELKKTVHTFIQHTLAPFCQNNKVIFDTIGKGPIQLP